MAAGAVIQIICNPASGRYKANDIAALEAAFARRGAETLVTHSSPCHPFVQHPRATMLCVAGGDGTLRHVVAALPDTCLLPIAVYPLGTVNLVAKELGNAHSADDMAARMLSGVEASKAYPGLINETPFMVCASAGPDSAAIAALSETLKRRIGRLAYLVALLTLMRRWPRPQIRLQSQDKQIDCEAFYVAKGLYYAGRWSFAPAARMTQPLFHVVALKSARRRDFLAFIAAVMTNRIDQNRNLIRFSCDTLAISGDAAWPVQADGDIVAALPVKMAVRGEPVLLF